MRKYFLYKIFFALINLIRSTYKVRAFEIWMYGCKNKVMILIIKQYDYACLYSPVSQFRKTLLCRDENIIGAPRMRNNFPFFTSKKDRQIWSKWDKKQ